MQLCYDEYRIKTDADNRMKEMKEAFGEDPNWEFQVDRRRRTQKWAVWAICPDEVCRNYEDGRTLIRSKVVALRKKKKEEAAAAEAEKAA